MMHFDRLLSIAKNKQQTNQPTPHILLFVLRDPKVPVLLKTSEGNYRNVIHLKDNSRKGQDQGQKTSHMLKAIPEVIKSYLEENKK